MTVVQILMAMVELQAAQPQIGFGEAMLRMVPMFVLVFFIFYFMVLRPQQQRQLQQEQLISGLKKGEGVVTTSGIIARVVSVESDHVVLDIGGGAKVKFERSAVARKAEVASAKAE